MSATAADIQAATANARHLVELTRTLTTRLEAETRAFQDRRPGDVVSSLDTTQDLTNQYRRETAQLKANPGLLASAPTSLRMALIEATQAFNTVLATHATTVEAARTLSEGIVKVIANEVVVSRAMGTGYGTKGQATAGDGRAVTLNRIA